MAKPLVVHVVGARPNYMKVAPVYSALENRGNVEQRADAVLVAEARRRELGMRGEQLTQPGDVAAPNSVDRFGGERILSAQ